MKQAFTLIELSIVLVILGLLIGGILTGQSLIHASELRGITTQYQSIKTSTMSFRDKYNAFPGDMTNATAFWGALGAGGTGACPATAGSGTETCDGNGDRLVNLVGASNERFYFWKHLANAELLEGTYTSVQGSGGNEHAIAEENAPAGRFKTSTWYVNSMGNVANDAALFNGSYNNYFMLGGQSAAGAPNVAIMTPEDMENVDGKIDDGMPAQGNVVPANRIGCALTADGSALTVNPADAAVKDAYYDLAAEDFLCVAIFRNIF